MINICTPSAEDTARRHWWTLHLITSMETWPQTSAQPFKAHKHSTKVTGAIALLVAVFALIKKVWLPTRRIASTIAPVSLKITWFVMENFSWQRRTCTQTSWEQPIATSSTKISPSTKMNKDWHSESSSARNLSTITMTSINEDLRWYEIGLFESYFILLTSIK